MEIIIAGYLSLVATAISIGKTKRPKNKKPTLGEWAEVGYRFLLQLRPSHELEWRIKSITKPGKEVRGTD